MKNSITTKLFNAVAIILLLGACSKSPQQSGTRIIRLDKEVATYKDLAAKDKEQHLDSLYPYIAGYMQIIGLDSIDIPALNALSQSNMIAMFAPSVDSVFSDNDKYLADIAMTDKFLENLSDSLPRCAYATVIWGKDKSIIVNDTVMYIALNHYLGSDHEAYSNWPEYKRINKRPDMLPYDVMETRLALAMPYAANKAKNTLLSNMVYEGALAYIKFKLIPDARLCNALGFSQEQLDDIIKNESLMWKRLVSGQMLYSTDAILLQNLLNPAPSSSMISPDAPGRAVRYIGYKIVDSYMAKYPDTALGTLLKPSFYTDKDILRKAWYSGK